MSNHHATRLSLLCERLIEACWLAALITTPLFFNVYSSRIFEPDKTALLRSIVLIMGLAWLVKGLEHWAAHRSNQDHRRALLTRSTWRSLWSVSTTSPVLSLALLLLVDYTFATAVSVAPRFSMWGSYARLQGLYTTSVYIGGFLSIVALLRTREQLERLITAALVASLPVSLYGIIQYFGTDPLSWASDVTQRVASSMGNPIFVAAFLILTVPLTLYRLLVSAGVAAKDERVGTKRVLVFGILFSLAFQMAAWQAGPSAGTASAVITASTWVAVAFLLGKPLLPFLRISSYTVLLSAQLMCIFFSQSRGPWLGLAVGLFLFALLWTLVQHQRKRALHVIGSGLTVALIIVTINLPASPLGFVRDVPYVGRLGQLFNAETGSARVRVLIWEGVENLLVDDPLRTLIGYGPETLNLVYPPHYPPELGRVERRDALPDRAHNETFDALVTTGLLGFVVYLLFFTSLFYYGLQWIGLLHTPARRKVFLALWFAGGGTGVLLARLIDGSWRFAGVSLSIGMMAGLLTYLCGSGFLIKQDRGTKPVALPLRLIGVTLLAALTAHFVEIHLGIAIVATRTYFWSYAALLVVAGSFRHRRPGPVEEVTTAPPPLLDAASLPRSSRHIPPLVRPFLRRPLIAASLIVGFTIVTLVYDFLVPRTSLTQASSTVWLFAFTWVFTGLVIITETWPTDHSMRNLRPWLGAFGVYAAITLTVALLYAAIYGGMLRRGDDLGSALLTYVGGVLLIIVALGYALQRGDPLPERTGVGRRGLAYLILTGGVLAALYATNLNVIRADVYFKQASQVHQQGQYDQAAALYKRALALEPEEDVYHLFLGKTLLEMAGASRDPEALLQEAERVLLQARALSPLNPDHAANLARLYQTWAQRTENPSRRTERFRQALTFFERATARSPNTAYLWNDWGTTYLLMGDTTEARRTYQHSLTLDDAFYQTYLLLGNLYYAQERWKDAAYVYEKALELEPNLPQVRLALAFVQVQIEHQKETDPTQ